FRKYSFNDDLGEVEFISHINDGIFMVGFIDDFKKRCFYTLDVKPSSQTSSIKRGVNNVPNIVKRGSVSLNINGAYSGKYSDGSKDRPFKTIKEAIKELPFVCDYAVLNIAKGN